MATSIQTVATREQWKAVCAIRDEVFVKEQQVDPQEEFDAYDRRMEQEPSADSDAVYVLAVDDETGKAVGTARYISDTRHGEPWAKVGRVAVLQHSRRKGVGRLMLTDLERVARQKEKSGLFLGGQAHATNFYTQLGYEAVPGSEFVEINRAHIIFEKKL